METGVILTGYDFVVLGLLLLFIARGFWVGLLRQISGLLALCIGYYFASQHYDKFIPFLPDFSDNPKVVFLTSFVAVFLATFLVAFLLGKLLSLVVEVNFNKWFDKSLGVLLGAVKASIVILLLHMVLGSVLSSENDMLRECQTCDGLNSAADYAREFIRNEDVRKSLIQQAPAISTEDVIEFFDQAWQDNGGEPKGNQSTTVE